MRMGLALVCIPRGQKGPINDGWNKPRNQANPGGYVTDPGLASEIWMDGQNLGVVLGPSGLVSFDVDHLEFTRRAFEAVGLDLDHLLEDAVRIEGNPDRAKALFQAPAEIALPSRRLRWPSGSDYPKGVSLFELRTGPLQDVLPPSIHPKTKRPYRWLRAPWEVWGKSLAAE
jgi:putative DNA primase/helicase